MLQGGLAFPKACKSICINLIIKFICWRIFFPGTTVIIKSSNPLAHQHIHHIGTLNSLFFHYLAAGIISFS
ncbi:MAG: hypothetical protein BGO54_07390 [Sphingobacteriales bacterium 46-32]|nr:MAG: hypothetical protein BGO54_07390 [Sphingobacteriales bacterium 46-32]